MAIAVQGAFSGANSGVGAITTTVSVTVSAGDDRALFGGASTRGSDTISNHAFDAVAATEILQISGGTGNAAARLSVYKFLDPAVKTADFTVDGSNSLVVGVVVLTGAVDNRAASTDNSNSDRTSVTLSPVSDTGDLVLDFLACEPNQNPTTGTGQTEQYDQAQASSGSFDSVCSTKAGAVTSTTMSYSWDTATRANYAALAVTPAAGGGGGVTMPIFAHHYNMMRAA